MFRHAFLSNKEIQYNKRKEDLLLARAVKWGERGVVLTRYASIMYRVCDTSTIDLRATRANAEFCSVKPLLIHKMSSGPVNSVI